MPTTRLRVSIASRARLGAMWLILPILCAACDDGGDATGGQDQGAVIGGGGGAAGSGGATEGPAAGAAGGAGAPTERAAVGEPCGGPAGPACEEGTLCESSEACGGAGVCRERPTGCLTACDVPPVQLCGCDGQVYCDICSPRLLGVAISPDPGLCAAP